MPIPLACEFRRCSIVIQLTNNPAAAQAAFSMEKTHEKTTRKQYARSRRQSE